jgi:phosphate starvation-inducible PhoH-like protein
MYLTRLGHQSKMIITGDPAQTDIPDSGLMEIIDKCRHRGSVGVIEFENADNVRHASVEAMLEDL